MLVQSRRAVRRLGCIELLESRLALATLPTLAADIDTIPLGSNPREFFVHDGALYFSALGSHLTGHELWRFDGERATQVGPINPTGRGAAPREFATFRGELYFQADHNDEDAELWRTNGAAVSLAADVNPGHGERGSYPRDLMVYGDELYFAATHYDDPGSGLFRFDGQTTTSIPRDQNPPQHGVNAANLVVFDGNLYFMAGDTSGVALYRLERDVATRVVELGPYERHPEEDDLTVFGDRLLLPFDNGTSGLELWSFDGTTLAPVADIHTGAGDSAPGGFVEFDGDIYFSATSSAGRELWRYDGAQVELVADVNTSGDSEPEALTLFDGSLCFSADDGTTGRELWCYDGAAATRMTDLNVAGDSVFDDMAVFEGALYFAGTNTPDYAGWQDNVEVWKFDGQDASLAIDVYQGNSHSSPFGAVINDGILYMSATESSTGDELHKYDGDTATLVADLVAGTTSSRPRELASFQGNVYFSTYHPNEPNRLWKYDGNDLTELRDASGEPLRIYLSTPFVEFAGSLYFAAHEPGASGEIPTGLWRYDGATLRQIPLPGYLARGVRSMAVAGDSLVLNALIYGTWQFDGTAFTELTSFFPSYAKLEEAAFIDGQLYFSASDQQQYGAEPWVSDLTPEGTRRIFDLSTGGYHSEPKYFVQFNGDVYFAASKHVEGTYTSRREIWKYDGNEVVKVTHGPTEYGIEPTELTVLGDAIYFAGNHLARGRELWRYDGQSSSVVADVMPGLLSSDPTGLIVYNGQLHFTAFDVRYGSELRKLVTVPNGDLDGDGRVGIADLAILQRNYHRAVDAIYGDGDINGDGVVNRADLAALSREFGRSSPANSSAMSPIASTPSRPALAARARRDAAVEVAPRPVTPDKSLRARRTQRNVDRPVVDASQPAAENI